MEYTEWTPAFENAQGSRYWNSWCPCCRRPIDVACFGAPSWPSAIGKDGATTCYTRRVSREPRYAYVAALWGSGPGFILGALVLGRSLRRTGTKYDLVLLHTEIPAIARELLSKLWTLKEVDYIHATSALFGHDQSTSRFAGVFTKLHALSLVEYDKVIMLDIDLAVLIY